MRVLITDIVWPSAVAKWRIEEICAFAERYDVDICVKKHATFQQIQKAVANISDRFSFAKYDFIVFDKQYNCLAEFNDAEFDGTAANGHYRGFSYLLRLKKYRNEGQIPTFGQYDVYYHIFWMSYVWFNSVVKVCNAKQYVKLYPGGGLSQMRDISNVDLTNLSGVVVTQDFVFENLKKPLGAPAIQVYGAPYLQFNQKLVQKRFCAEKQLTVAFCSLGAAKEKGNHIFQQIVNKYLASYPLHNIKFVSIGLVHRMNGVEQKGVMSQTDLDELYFNEIDVYINPQTTVGVHGWPLGAESMFQGCVMLTTDQRNDNAANNFNFTEEEMIRLPRGDAHDFVEALALLYDNRGKLFDLSIAGQKKAFELFCYDKMLKPIFEMIESG